MAFWSVVLAVALITTKAGSTQDDLRNDTTEDRRRGLSFILPPPYKDPNLQPENKAMNPFLRRKSHAFEAPPQSTVTREPDIIVKYVDGHEEVFEESHRKNDLDGERVRRQVESSEESGGRRAPDLARDSSLDETANNGDETQGGGAEGGSTTSRSADDVTERTEATEGGEEEASQIAVTLEPITQANVDRGKDETKVLDVTEPSVENREVGNEHLAHNTDGAEAETTTVKRERLRQHQTSDDELPDIIEMSSSLGFSIRQYYQDLLNYYSLYQLPDSHSVLDPINAAYETPGTESGIYTPQSTNEQNLPHYYVVYPYGSNWAPAGRSSLKQRFLYESPVSEAAASDVYRLTMDRLQEALRASDTQPNGEDSASSPKEPPLNPHEASYASKESRSPSFIPSQLRALFSRVGRGAAAACRDLDDSRESPQDSHSKEELEPRDKESDSDNRPHGFYTTSAANMGPVQGSENGNGAADTTRPTHDSISSSSQDHQVSISLTDSGMTSLHPQGETPYSNHFPYNIQLGYSIYAVNRGDVSPATARVLASHSKRSSEEQHTYEIRSNREYQATGGAQIVLANPFGYEALVDMGDQVKRGTNVDSDHSDQTVSGGQGKYKQGEITGANQPVYGIRLVSDDLPVHNDEQPYYVSVAHQDTQVQDEPDAMIVQEDRRQRNYEKLYPFILVHHGQEL
ncbi:uncharacterized protein LOC122255296 isoform X2 [Penaeus japonicus]|uniref:uncharacterized protein LOC122255296 isoform X2 n=1 Tax=Penaeus japonicus TaxID=27405 RepID=UPI001C70C30C|nr:uncharacterized protein LOC122255296 isoform X2 [Penaeus japonicus]